MTSFKAMFCDLCIILLVGLIAVFAEKKPSTLDTADDGPKGSCSCGGFPTSTPAPGDEPLLSQTPGLVVRCDDEGQATCRTLCSALATATKAKGPEILCNKLKNAHELKLSAFSKICDKMWIYADMTAELPLCCQDTKVTVCPSVEQLNTTSANVTEPKKVMYIP